MIQIIKKPPTPPKPIQKPNPKPNNEPEPELPTIINNL